MIDPSTSSDESTGLGEETVADLPTSDAVAGGLPPAASAGCAPDPSTNWCWTQSDACELWTVPVEP